MPASTGPQPNGGTPAPSVKSQLTETYRSSGGRPCVPGRVRGDRRGLTFSRSLRRTVSLSCGRACAFRETLSRTWPGRSLASGHVTTDPTPNTVHVRVLSVFSVTFSSLSQEPKPGGQLRSVSRPLSAPRAGTGLCPSPVACPRRVAGLPARHRASHLGRECPRGAVGGHVSVCPVSVTQAVTPSSPGCESPVSPSPAWTSGSPPVSSLIQLLLSPLLGAVFLSSVPGPRLLASVSVSSPPCCRLPPRLWPSLTPGSLSKIPKCVRGPVAAQGPGCPPEPGRGPASERVCSEARRRRRQLR